MNKILSESELQRLLNQGAKLNAADAFRIAEHYYACSDYDSAFQWYQKTCKKPSPPPNALFNLGYAYQHGEGTAIDFAEALRWYRKAADCGSPQAYYNLAYFYQNGLFVQQDEQKANDCIRHAEELMGHLSDSNYELQERCKTLDSTLHATQILLEKCSQERDSIRADKTRLEVDLKDAQMKSKQMSLEIASEKEFRRSAEKSCDTASKKLREAQDKCTQLDSKCTSLETSQKTLQDNYDGLQRVYMLLAQDSQKITDQQTAIQGELSHLTAQLAKSEANLSREQERSTQYRRDLASTNKKLQDSLSSNQELHHTNQLLLQRKPFLKKRTVLIGLSLLAGLSSISVIFAYGMILTSEMMLDDLSIALWSLAGSLVMATTIEIVSAVKVWPIVSAVVSFMETGLFSIMVFYPQIFCEELVYFPDTYFLWVLLLSVPVWILFVTLMVLPFKKEEL